MKCTRSGPNGSCPLDAVEGSLFCEKHSNEAALRSNYVLADAKLAEKLSSKPGDVIYSLRDEVTLMRAMIEDRLNMAKSDAEKLVAYNQVAAWIGTVDKLVNSLNRLEKEVNSTLTKDALFEVARKLIQVIVEEVQHLPGHENVIDAISHRVVPVIEDASN